MEFLKYIFRDLNSTTILSIREYIWDSSNSHKHTKKNRKSRFLLLIKLRARARTVCHRPVRERITSGLAYDVIWCFLPPYKLKEKSCKRQQIIYLFNISSSFFILFFLKKKVVLKDFQIKLHWRKERPSYVPWWKDLIMHYINSIYRQKNWYLSVLLQ